MAFRETIEAVLKVKDANRFKAGMDKAARSVRKLGRDEEEAAAQTELLEKILQRLERQSYENTAAMMAVAHSVDELGDEMVQTAAKTQLMNTAMKKSGSNAIFLGKSWAFWKDRLSLTRSEILTTALTIGAYFSPAIVALGSSFAHAAIGGGGVAGAGMASFVFGLVSLISVAKPVVDQMKKIQKAQDQYNLAVEQYGASSKQASRQSAHLYGIIRTQGGKPVADATENLAKFKKEWAKSTAPARGSILGMLSGGIGALRNLQPTLSSGTNIMAAATGNAMKGVFRTLTGGEMKATFRTLAGIFAQSIGPGLRGATNLVVIFGRVIRAAAPWVVKWALAWERVTDNWRASTSDQKRVSKFLDTAVKHFLAWWGLAKALGRILRTVFGSSADEGLKVVYALTGIVTKMDEWLQQANDTGKINAFWDRYNQSMTDILNAIQNPVAAIRKWLPQLMDVIATTLATHAPQMAATFAYAFANSGGWAQFLTIAWALKKFGFFKWVGGQVGMIFVKPFIRAFGTAFIASIGGEALAGSLGVKLSAVATKAGTGFGKLFGAGFLIGLLFLLPEIEKQLDNLAKRYGFKVNKPKTEERRQYGKTTGILEPFIRKNIPGVDELYSALLDRDSQGVPHRRRGRGMPIPGGRGRPPGGALGGVIPPGGSALVGETGMEMARAGARGTEIIPLSRNSRNNFPAQIDLPNLENAMHITVFSTVQVDRREIGRAVNEQVAFQTARRGGTPVRRDG